MGTSHLASLRFHLYFYSRDIIAYFYWFGWAILGSTLYRQYFYLRVEIICSIPILIIFQKDEFSYQSYLGDIAKAIHISHNLSLWVYLYFGQGFLSHCIEVIYMEQLIIETAVLLFQSWDYLWHSNLYNILERWVKLPELSEGYF